MTTGLGASLLVFFFLVVVWQYRVLTRRHVRRWFEEVSSEPQAVRRPVLESIDVRYTRRPVVVCCGEAKRLALKMMDKGSYQIECSDEGLMQEEVESCLRIVIFAVADSQGAGEWALEMLRRDRIGCLCEQELTELAGPVRGVR